MIETVLTRLLTIDAPIVQAPMAGGPTTPELIAAVSNAGGLGSLGAGYLSPEQIRSAIRHIRTLTDRPFGVNLFVPGPGQAEEPEEAVLTDMAACLDVYRRELGIPERPSLHLDFPSFEEQIDVVLEERVPVFSFTFGIPSPEVMERLSQHGTFVIGTATTVDEAIRLERAGAHAVVAQGSEAGGHRGTFLKEASESLIGLMALVPQIADHVAVPVIASGGIMDGRGLAASLTLGASAVQMGTAFLTCTESGAHPTHKQKILAASEDATEVTNAYSGKAARGIQTTFMRSMPAGRIPAYPIQHAMTTDIRQASARANNPEYMSLWAGQGLRLANAQSAAVLIEKTIAQAQKRIAW
ncbi:nitronate monooxygenase [Paenibacillus sp. IB182496]|uniref:Probable nitronate monooxygenase n=1 Tax=Paenibacillus sabuli TaxID=2772509 RepID=A0A927BN24_9BACL|nr:nitronate monooxygenase [Paenibacillus sabuli]MBD2843568.1 nitronate monooxygenase [Paenibacillus sabuli]